MKPLILNNVHSRFYNLIIEEKVENGKKIPYLIIQNKIILSERAILEGGLALQTYRFLKRYAKSGRTKIYEEECKKIILSQKDATPRIVEKKIEVIEKTAVNNDIYIMEYPTTLTSEQYDRLKESLDSSWPKHLPRPILLEGGITIRKMTIGE